MPTKTIKLGKEDSQIFLYAKGHFNRERSMDDVRLLIAAWSGSYGLPVADIDVLGILMGLAKKLELQNRIADIRFMATVLMGGPYGKPMIPEDKDRSPFERFVFSVLDEIHSVRVVIDGEPFDLVQYEPIDKTIFEYNADGFDNRGFNRNGVDRYGRDKAGYRVY